MEQKITQQNNFFYLTAALILLLMSSSLVQAVSDGLLEYILQGVTALTFIICLVSLRFDTGWYRFLISMTCCWLVAILLRNVVEIQKLDVVMLILMFAFFFGTFKSIIKQILFTGDRVDSNKIIGSVALFLLLGLMWSIGYLLIMEFAPESFTGMTHKPWGENFSRMAYFSFVTLTTLGYGDISPASPFSQSMVYMEAITGVFYMAIVVASLVSSSQNNQKK
ncbi:potassium channel family protein [Alkalimarinus sediminis]|uniref:Potassium channel family protein n=1 Tax=Alkalimarinus sediminis TaxID=1632866 RepID=A0A9E8KP26_9ALTE|nr:potassium channel family protein [Alkalimarinus sediminis]UZW74299.1 potassium channel family protein [Alkalimarinus sediminis]